MSTDTVDSEYWLSRLMYCHDVEAGRVRRAMSFESNKTSSVFMGATPVISPVIHCFDSAEKKSANGPMTQPDAT